MKLFAPKETHPGETRAALVPEAVRTLATAGFQVVIEADLGAVSGYPDATYREAGAEITSDPNAAAGEADIVLRVRKPAADQIAAMKAGAIHASFFDPFNNKDLLDAFNTARVTAISMEMMPRTTLAQKMDALSSQANLAGYQAVILAAERLNRIIPMMMTPAGTISPARFFVIGVGVAGLQAIATAKRLGARVDAFDTRPVVEEQVKSLGAKFVKIDLGDTGQTDQGYAKQLTDEQLERQREGMAKVCGQADVVITTAKLFGRKAPTIVTNRMLDAMKRDSFVVDLAAEAGGNVEGTELDKEVTLDNGVTILGHGCLEGMVPFHASQVYASNLTNLLMHFWDAEARSLQFSLEDEILKGCVLTHDGATVNGRYLEIVGNNG